VTGPDERIAGLERQVGKLAEELRALREETLRVRSFDEIRLAYLGAGYSPPVQAATGRRPRHLQVVSRGGAQ
jgi:hypothetical protein